MSKLVIIGCGNMGSAIIESLLNKNLFKADDLIIVEKFPNEFTAKFKALNATLLDDIENIDFTIQTMLLAIKPQSALAAFEQLKTKVSARSLVISIMAGITIESMEASFSGAQVIRCMPNTPCSIRQGMSVYCGNERVMPESFDFAKRIFNSFGKSLQVSDEGMIDSATAISGSGPAYLFYLAECLKEGGVRLGFTESQAEILATQTVYGSASLLKQSDDSASVLRQKVTSPGGTTEAALNYFDEKNLKDVLLGGFRAAFDRSVELRKLK